MKIIITGGSDGIGLETAKLLASKGNQITLVARNKEKLDAALASLSGSGHSVIAADLSVKADVDSLKEQLAANKYDVLINDAGVGMYGVFTEMDLSEQVKMINLNVIALTVLSHFYLSQAKKGDALINVASTLGTTSFPGSATYSATKAYVTIFSESLWWENKSRGVYVAAFCPGSTTTNFHKRSGGKDDQFSASLSQNPTEVAIELVRALEKRNGPKIVSGLVSRSMLFFQRFMSRKMVVNMMGSFSPINKKA